jgi:hypothetical protein
LMTREQGFRHMYLRTCGACERPSVMQDARECLKEWDCDNRDRL